MTAVRSSPSGPLVEVEAASNPLVTQIGWIPAVGPSNVLELAPAGHTPGLYLIIITATVHGPGAPLIQGLVTHSAPLTLGNDETFVEVPSGTLPVATSPGFIFGAVTSTGATAIRVQFDPTGGGGTTVDLYATASLVAPL